MDPLISRSAPTAWIVDLTSWQPSFEQWAWTFVSPSEQRRIGACVDSGERLRRLVGYLTVRCLATTTLGLSWQDVSLARDRRGKPFIQEAPWLCFNLSHSGHYVLAAFAASPIGADIERRRSIADAFLHYALTADEYGYVAAAADPALRAERFLRVWTRKESYFKAIGTGLTGNWRQASFVSGNSPRSIWHGWRFTEWTIAREYIAVICSNQPGVPSLHQTTPQTLLYALETVNRGR